ncbi:MAG: tRNA lysidine(34) synthetase TilS [Planctomycetes bacterium]|nr:tRNA lysidine(34) synthetase TilS [Planctomycetota bacterium]
MHRREPTKSLEQSLGDVWPATQWQDLTVIAAVSGGADSVALLRSLHAVKVPGRGRLIAAHFNHNLRGADSDADQAFVRQLCRDLSLPCETARAKTDLKSSSGDALEAEARTARYDFLKQIAHQSGARFVATGHTADDQAETVLHHILRGTGLAGLSGMPRTRILTPTVTLIRPMLNCRRTDVLEYLSQLNQPYQTDESNCDDRMTRNRIRHRLLPLLADEFNAQVVDSLLRLGEIAHEAQSVISELAQELLATRVSATEAKPVIVDCRGLENQPVFLVREMLRVLWQRLKWPQQAMTHRHWCELADLASGRSDVGALTMPGEIKADRNSTQLRLARNR